MVCPVRGDWIVPRRLMCLLFWTGTVLLFAGILLVVTSKHKGTTFLWWGGVLLGVGSCVLLSCLVLCIHAYYVIAETRSNAEHTLINNLQLQRKAQYSSHSCSLNLDGVQDNKGDFYTSLDHHNKPHSNGGNAESLRPTGGPIISQTPRGGGGTRQRSQGRGERGTEDREELMDDEEGDIRPMHHRSRDSLVAPNSRGGSSIYTVSKAQHEVVFSTPPPPHGLSFPFVPPPDYSQLGSSQVHSTVSRVPGSPAVHPSTDRVDSADGGRGKGQSPQNSLSSTTGVINSHPRRFLASGVESRKGQRSRITAVDVINTSSQSSAPNSSFELEPEVVTDQELSGALTTPGWSKTPQPHRETRLLNNTPVNMVDPYSPPGRVSNPEQSSYESDEYATDPITNWKTSPGARTDAIERPITPGTRRFVGSESITRPFGLGSVTVTPLYRPPKTPPSRHSRELVLEVTSRDLDTHRVSARTPESHMTFAPERRAVPVVSVTSYPPGRETDITVCQSDVTVYDNVIDSVRV